MGGKSLFIVDFEAVRALGASKLPHDLWRTSKMPSMARFGISALKANELEGVKFKNIKCQ